VLLPTHHKFNYHSKLYTNDNAHGQLFEVYTKLYFKFQKFRTHISSIFFTIHKLYSIMVTFVCMYCAYSLQLSTKSLREQHQPLLVTHSHVIPLTTPNELLPLVPYCDHKMVKIINFKFVSKDTKQLR